MVEIKVTTSLCEDEEKLLKYTQDELSKIEKRVQEMSYKISDLANKYDHEYSIDTWNSLQNIAYDLDNFYFNAKYLIETFRREHINL
jgi:hypothetical protein